MSKPVEKSAAEVENHHEEMANAIDTALNSSDAPVSTRTLISRTQKSVKTSIANLQAHRTSIERKISELRADHHQVTETLAALEAAASRLAETASAAPLQLKKVD